MPTRRTNKPKPEQTEPSVLTVEPSSSVKDNIKTFIVRAQEVMHNPQFQLISGIIIAVAVLYLLLSLISFLFTANADFSILSEPWAFRRAHRETIHNFMGLIGADMAFFLVHKTFGWASIGLLVFLSFLSFKLMRVYHGSLWRPFFACAFATLWGSVVLALCQVDGLTSYLWGGRHGEYVSTQALSFLQLWGTILMLVGMLIVFLICIDKQTVPRTKRLWAKLVSRFKKDKTPTEPEPEQDPSDNLNTEEGNDGITITDITTDDSETDNTIDLTTDDGPTTPLTTMDDDNFVVQTHTEETTEETTEQGEEGEEGEEGEKPDHDEGEGEGEGETPAEGEGDDDLDMGIEVNVEEMLKKDPEYLLKKLGPYDPRLELSRYEFPSLSLLRTLPNENTPVIDMAEQQANKDQILHTFRNFGIEITGIKATIGPTVTLYQIVPKEGTRIAKIQGLEKDIMLSLAANGIRIIAPIPGTNTVGIEVPNKKPQTVSMHSVVASKRFQEEKKMRLPVAMGKTITNEVFMFDLAKTPHLLVAGATGQGKSVGLNAIITSLLYKKHPAELKFVLVDPKMVEFNLFEPLVRHFMAAMPGQEEIIITDCQKVINTLNSLVIEMEDRYMLLMDAHVRNLEDYNEKFQKRQLNPEKDIKDSHGGVQHHRFLPYIVIIIDEFGDFIMQAGKQVETPIARITQKARAVGMHMILATQRPSVNIVTGVIKANIPTRIAFRTQSVVDSRTVLDQKGAEGLVGRGDMLYSGGTEVTRIQCAFVDTPEVETIVKSISEQQHFTQPYQLPDYVPEGEEGEALAPGSVDLKRLDPLFKDVATYVVSKQEGSSSKLQRAFEIGYNRAGKLSDQLEAAGIVGPNKGPKGRDVLVQDMMQLAQILEGLGLS